MELLDRYLEAVKKYLPWERQDDILAELRVNLEAQLDEREDELGRPMTQEEAAAWVKQLGPPMQMAAKYHPQRYLIGPGLFPIYWYVLRLVFFWASIIYTVVSVVNLAVNGAGMLEVTAAVLRLPSVLVTAAAWVTLIFAVIEYLAARNPEKYGYLVEQSANWVPQALPQLDPNAGTKPKGKAKTYAQAVVEVSFHYFFLGWLLLVPKNPFLMLGPAAFYFTDGPFMVAPVVRTCYWVIVGLNLVQALWMTINLWTGGWRGRGVALHLVSKSIGLVPMILALAAPPEYVLLRDPMVTGARYGEQIAKANQGMHYALMVVTAIVAIQLVAAVATEVRRRMQRTR